MAAFVVFGDYFVSALVSTAVSDDCGWFFCEWAVFASEVVDD